MNKEELNRDKRVLTVADLQNENIKLRSLYEQVISRINKLDDDTKEAMGHPKALSILILDKFLADITKLVGE